MQAAYTTSSANFFSIQLVPHLCLVHEVYSLRTKCGGIVEESVYILEGFFMR